MTKSTFFLSQSIVLSFYCSRRLPECCLIRYSYSQHLLVTNLVDQASNNLYLQISHLYCQTHNATPHPDSFSHKIWLISDLTQNIYVFTNAHTYTHHCMEEGVGHKKGCIKNSTVVVSTSAFFIAIDNQIDYNHVIL